MNRGLKRGCLFLLYICTTGKVLREIHRQVETPICFKQLSGKQARSERDTNYVCRPGSDQEGTPEEKGLEAMGIRQLTLRTGEDHE